MKIVITDCEYRSSVSLVQALGALGHELILCQGGDMKFKAPSFASVYASQTHRIDSPAGSPEYMAELRKICEKTGERPVLLPVGAKTISALVSSGADADGYCRLLLPEKETLDRANDKAAVQRAAESAGIKTPETYRGVPDEFPVVIKPACGEKFGLKAKDRYVIVRNGQEFGRAYEKMSQYGGAPVVQRYISGAGVGVCAVMDRSSFPACVLCHRRIREYPVSGGPSTCCISFYDEELVNQAVGLLKAMNYRGIAMVEFKESADGYYLLEINPRVWGSFPMTLQCGSGFASIWAEASAGKTFTETDSSYVRGTKMRFLVNDTAATLALLKSGRLPEFFRGVGDMFDPRVKEALHFKGDNGPFRQYIRNVF